MKHFLRGGLRYLFLIPIYFIACSVAVAQGITVQGKVTDEGGAGLPGVTVLLKGTSTASPTDVNGVYSIDVPTGNGTLVFSYIGFLPQEVVINNRTTIDVRLGTDAKALDEIVVVGYGTQKRSDITGSVASIPKDRLSNLPVTDITQAIQGTTAGLSISQGSSVPGSSGTMRVRGVNSLSANTSPFLVVDGVPFFGAINDLNPNDIASIEVLKDASSVAIYGTRGANGVILITTKRGTSGKPRVSYSGYYGVEGLANKFEPMSPEAYLQKYKDYMIAQKLTQNQILPNTREVDAYNAGLTTDWLDEATQTGKIQEHNLSVAGGTENIQYYLGGGYLTQTGVVKGYQFTRGSIRANLDATVTNYLKVGTSLFFADKNSDGGRANLLNATAMSPYSVPRDALGNYELFPMHPELLFANPLLGLVTDRVDRNKNLNGNVYAEVSPGFVKGLKYRLNASTVYTIGRQAGYTGRAANDMVGSAYANNNETQNWVVENILSYNKDWDKHHVDFTGLYSAQENNFFTSGASANSFINDELSFYNLEAGTNRTSSSRGERTALLSQMGRINYSYDSRYLLTVTARRDGFSAFGVNDKYAVFPSIALGWNIANEAFFQNVSFVNQLKLRVSHGQAGNQAVPAYRTATLANSVRIPFGGTSSIGVLASELGNAGLNWETTTSTNIGVDFGFFQNRINGTLEVYRSRTEDLLVRRNIPVISGYSRIWDNLGELENRGIEFTLNTINMDAGKFRWETNFNISSNRNQIVSLYGEKKDDLANGWLIGRPIGAIYNYRMVGIWQAGEDNSKTDPTAKPGDIKFEDINKDGVINDNDRTYIGSTQPKWYGGLTNTFHYGNFHLSVFLQTSQGSLKGNPDIFYGDEAGKRNIPAAVGYWTPENMSNEWPSLSYRNPRGYNFARDNSYVRIKDVRLSYTVPGAFLEKYKLGSLTLYAAGRNLYTFTDWIGWDPENNHSSRGSGDWTNNYPLTRAFSFGLNLTL
ncbi:SusC/RagA family TonB-linked outer membrane protein [Rufibacter tibetensis]|uniref:SusC/RagA family TonB-linked outer membrane protein n=1 Tax=Rufibacter tibetensis TaxID=512763 RepID=A0A0N7HW62_9BACT|nr:TonB-dependent receptor [Rufibacter tibetensis]ALI98360.1 SusC/RagA family TonB-linked outer membrane protein [Rufibacter tibetensis]